jgi:hypothetical protein
VQARGDAIGWGRAGARGSSWGAAHQMPAGSCNSRAESSWHQSAFGVPAGADLCCPQGRASQQDQQVGATARVRSIAGSIAWSPPPWGTITARQCAAAHPTSPPLTRLTRGANPGLSATTSNIAHQLDRAPCEPPRAPCAPRDYSPPPRELAALTQGLPREPGKRVAFWKQWQSSAHLSHRVCPRLTPAYIHSPAPHPRPHPLRPFPAVRPRR